jgi:phosphoglycerate dehydrogenase-like enzyme
MKHLVLLTQRFNDSQLARLRAVSPDLEIVQRSLSEAQDNSETGSLLQGDEEVLYCLIPPRDLSAAPHLKWIQLHSAGINQLTNHPLLESDIQITTASGVHSIPIGEFSIALILGLARRLPRLVRMQEGGRWPEERWRTFLGAELRGKTLGVVGYGSIGRHAARIAKLGFAMRILAMTRTGTKRDLGFQEHGVGDPEGEFPDHWYTPDQLPTMLTESDFVLIGAPLTEQTRLMIGEPELRAMKPSAFLVNVSRGEIVDEQALVHALKENWIAGAGLDVFAHEPLAPESELWKLENVLLAPHVSAATPSYDDRTVTLFSENLRRYARGERLLNLVDKKLRY